MTRDEMIQKLHEGVCIVTFKKADGSERVMKCTLVEDVLPPATKEDPLSQKKIRAVNEEVVPVWDVERNGWRSFRVDSVVDFR